MLGPTLLMGQRPLGGGEAPRGAGPEPLVDQQRPVAGRDQDLNAQVDADLTARGRERLRVSESLCKRRNT
jgi:hypothetical protein